MYKKLISILLTLILIAAFTGCTSVKEIITGDVDDDAEYQKSSTVNFAISNIKTLNPIVSHDEDTYYISKLVYQGLFSLDENLMPQNDLAQKYTISKNKKSITVTLDDKARFSDGEKVTASDVEFSVNCYKQAGDKSIYSSYVSCISSVAVKADNKVKITFTQVGEGSINRLVFPILPEHKYNSVSELMTEDENFKPVGSGSYRVAKYDGSTLILKPNKEKSGKTADNRLVFNVYHGDADIMNLTDGNLVSFSVNKDIERQTEIGSKNLKIQEFVSNEVEFVGFNCKGKLTSDKNIRQAIAYAIDVKSIINKVYFGSGVETDSLFYPGFYETENKGDIYKQSRKKSKDILEKAGFKDIDKDGYLENADGNNIIIKILVNNSKVRKNAAETIADNLEKVSLQTEIISCGKSQYNSYLKSGKFDIYVGGAKISEYYDMSAFVGTDNYTRYENAQAFALAADINTLDTTENIKTSVEKLKGILSDELPYYPLMYRTYSAVVSNELTGDIAPMFFDYYNNCEDWYSNYKVTETEKTEK